MAGQLVHAVGGGELAPLDHAAQRDPGRALGHPEQRAPLHEPAARHPGRAHPEQQAPDQRPGRERPVEELARSERLTFLCHLFEKCNIGAVTAATMLPDPEALDRVPTRPSASPRTPARRRRGATSCAASRTRATRSRVILLYAQTIGIVVAAVWIDNWFVWALAFVLMGRAHAQFAALMHEAAHRLLFRNRRVNDWVGRWLLGFPSFTPIDLYRRGHMAHHRDEFGPDEPDIPLYRGYPITRASLRRKLTRDADGPHRLQAVQGPAARRARAGAGGAVAGAAHRRRAARAHRDRRRARTTRGCTSSSGSRRTSPSGA